MFLGPFEIPVLNFSCKGSISPIFLLLNDSDFDAERDDPVARFDHGEYAGVEWCSEWYCGGVHIAENWVPAVSLGIPIPK